MKIIVSGEDLTADLLNKIKNNFFRHISLQELSLEHIELLEIPALWKIEYKEQFHEYSLLINKPQSKATSLIPFEKFRNKLYIVPANMQVNNLSKIDSEKDFVNLYLKFMKDREHIDAHPFYIPYKGGFISSFIQKIKIICWQFFKFIVDRIAFRQNLINSYLSSAIEFEHKLMSEEIQKLHKRIDQLEKQLRGKSDQI